ncbi:hypothetical protein KL929_003598 [Ogataea haglerorum]|uniref:uncharacterized protein n=1 Tax=Ogataea haglerorum TaxID=1937702 RepID=UPI001C89C61F|nr:uncharacterized protein KL911_002695 [Ogataea haglerorum]KAG7694690.1 hypothetical protein KL951_003867 [Ogataea haglerorum]KAG7738341.1 hypothetical protein KL923_003038 [Ogataea haglerorum]KAG7747574.1 hypothetical protein KL912_002946 [Ogataea haglerorum]KAG7753302.1 hypothetical protein KL911_002695 [Ogataea haglerorum]KAG7789240.1 hypothetical protein KL910_002938 [Ogataea haglerorum]
MSKPSPSAKDVVKYLKRRSGDLLHLHSDSGMKTVEEHLDAKSGPCNRLSFDVGVCENRNSKYRPSMEDVHTYVANFAERLDWGYFAVFDGHAGKNAARWCGSNLHNILVEKIMDDDNVDLRENLNSSFLEADVQMEREIQGSSGCTAAVAVLRWEEEIDDSASEDEVDPKTTPFDFSSDKLEQQRIVNSGGIMLKNRVNGVLAVTRSLGDVYLKSLVIGAPFTTCTELTDQDDFLILACDGLWDVCSDQDAVDLIKDEMDPYKASDTLCKLAISKMSTDNVTAMVVRFDTRVFAYTEPHRRAAE